jgi:hypothetical protein
VIDLDPSAQALPRVDLIHHVFDVAHLRDSMNHHEPEDLHGDVDCLVPLVCVLKGGMDACLYLPSFLSPSRSAIFTMVLLTF